jgi:cytoskeletal protein RodZ
MNNMAFNKNKKFRVGKKAPPSRLSPWYVVAAIVALGLVIGGAYWYQQKNEKEMVTTTAQHTSETPEQIEEEVEQNKEEISQPENNETTPSPTTPQTSTPSNLKAVTPIITYAGYSDPATKAEVEVDAFVPELYEDGGTCTMTAKKGSATVTKQQPANKQATTTNCQNFFISSSEFSSGTWDVTVKYKSGTAEGTSGVTKMEL